METRQHLTSAGGSGSVVRHRSGSRFIIFLKIRVNFHGRVGDVTMVLPVNPEAFRQFLDQNTESLSTAPRQQVCTSVFGGKVVFIGGEMPKKQTKKLHLCVAALAKVKVTQVADLRKAQITPPTLFSPLKAFKPRLNLARKK